jgi:hypothetical protein
MKIRFDMTAKLRSASLGLTFLTLTGISVAQAPSHSTAVQTLHCIKEGKWLPAPLSEQTQWQVSYARDLKSYPGDDTLVVVFSQAAEPDRSFTSKENGPAQEYLSTLLTTPAL